ncbi:DUF2187 family protein [Bacillus salitolerans]|uniref:DUF2187 family protein n=1 Tax=Bacillus salitolerans TaxID=1437434 RepID=A0ABW4LP38_9BACI
MSAKTKRAKPSYKNIAFAGDLVKFTRMNKEIIGTVVISRENSFIVELEKKDVAFLDIESDRTVVSHHNYQLV